MNDDELMKSFLRAAKESRQHRIKLDFKCDKCGQDVYKTMNPVGAPLPTAIWSIGCKCGLIAYSEDVEMTAERWAEIRP